MNMIAETRKLMSLLFYVDPVGQASLSIAGSTPQTLSISVAAGTMPMKPPYVGHRRDILAGVVQRMQQLRWASYDDFTLSLPMPTDDMMQALRERHPACQSPLECGEGWLWLLDATFAYVSEMAPEAEWRSTQIKEKFGGLRLHYHGDVGVHGDDIIDAAEWIGGYVCDVCGAPGYRRKDGWIVTRCDLHSSYVEF